MLITVLIILFVYNLGIWNMISRITNVHNGSVKAPGMLLTFLTPDFSIGIQHGDNVNFENFSFNAVIRNFNMLIWFTVFVLFYITACFKLKEREL